VPRDVTADLVTMTGNVAQVFLGDDEWQSVLAAAHRCLTPGGRLVFETRDPARKAWLTWNRAASYRVAEVPLAGRIRTWDEVTDVQGEYVTFRSVVNFASDGATLVSHSTLRFRGKRAIADSLAAAGFDVPEIRDAPDRPGSEWVIIAARPLVACRAGRLRVKADWTVIERIRVHAPP